MPAAFVAWGIISLAMLSAGSPVLAADWLACGVAGLAIGWQATRFDGVRIDHVDGLAEPREYCQRLRQRLGELRDGEPYIVVEKILGRGEPLRGDWPIHGTTGYEFAAIVNRPRRSSASSTQAKPSMPE